MDRIIEELIVNEQRNHELYSVALAQYLAMKGIIDLDEFSKYLDAYSHEYIKRCYPELFS
jgi:hypothetical protein